MGEREGLLPSRKTWDRAVRRAGDTFPEGPDEVVERLPSALHGLIFEAPEARRDLALLIGEMIAVFSSKRSKGELVVISKGNCEWVEQTSALQGTRAVAPCFSEDGSLEKIVLNRGDHGDQESARPVKELDLNPLKRKVK